MTTGEEARADTRILIADDHDSFRSGLRAVLGTADGLVVVGEAASGSEAVNQVAALHPDVVLMDLAMPGLGGIEAGRGQGISERRFDRYGEVTACQRCRRRRVARKCRQCAGGKRRCGGGENDFPHT